MKMKKILDRKHLVSLFNRLMCIAEPYNLIVCSLINYNVYIENYIAYIILVIKLLSTN